MLSFLAISGSQMMSLSAAVLETMPDWTLWLGIMLVALILEAITVSMVSLWFAIGALVALVLNMMHQSFTIQLVGMLAVSLVSLLIFFWRRKANPKNVLIHTNADRYLNRTGIVTQAIDPIHGSGLVVVDGQTWSAKSERKDQTIEVNKKVRVLEIRGAHLIVREEP